MTRPLQADCAACCGLCCVGPAFDAAQGFGYDKPAGVPCRHLGPAFQCAIHATRTEAGFGSCVTFDCHGAGQWVTQRRFGGRSWQSDPAEAEALFAAFTRTRVLHELLAAVARLAPSLAREVEAAADEEDRRPGSVNLPALRRHVIEEGARYVPQNVASTRSSSRGGSDSSSDSG